MIDVESNLGTVKTVKGEVVLIASHFFCVSDAPTTKNKAENKTINSQAFF